MRGVGVAGLLMGSMLLVGCAGAGLHEVPFEQRAWTSPVKTQGVQLLTEHYDIRTTLQDDGLRDCLPTFMENCFLEYSKLVPLPTTTPAASATSPTDTQQSTKPRMVIYLYGKRIEWAAFTKGFAPAQAETYLHIHAGGYMDSATSVTFYDGRDHTLSLLAHEGLHQYLACYFSHSVPAWLNEGLATQFEDFDLDGARPIFQTKQNLTRRNHLQQAVALENGMIPLRDLLSMHAGQAVVKTGQAARGYYAQVWAMVSFLREEPSYRKQFARLLADAGTERLRVNIRAYRATMPAAREMSDGEVVFRHYITEDLDGFAREYRAYAQTLVN
ncbi:MAG: DUF1570 domain-containing protein [Phycisphaerae bacterium]|nr:DUF1570 domain-containing protein [Phycisphaerae bacterium]